MKFFVMQHMQGEEKPSIPNGVRKIANMVDTQHVIQFRSKNNYAFVTPRVRYNKLFRLKEPILFVEIVLVINDLHLVWKFI